MSNADNLPVDLAEKASLLEAVLIAAATGGERDNETYQALRREIINEPMLKQSIPSFVRTYRNLDAFWPFIKEKARSYAERRRYISEEFNPLVEQIEGEGNAPGDQLISGGLHKFDADGVQAIWLKALDRRETDPEGAITLARTLLETVSKRILDELGEEYSDRDDLPKLYSRAAKSLNLAPNQHAEEPIKAILGGAMTLVNGIGTLRNRLSDSHGRGGKLPVKPTERHAKLAVNTAGAIATFLTETHFDRTPK